MTNTKERQHLSIALSIATEAHENQVDKAGQPYLLHALRVMSKGTTNTEKLVGLLHDVVEDSDYTIKILGASGFGEPIIDAVDAITKRAGEPYDDYIIRVKSNPIARMVKIYDLEDNLDLKRLPCIKEKDLHRINKYLASRSFLLS